MGRVLAASVEARSDSARSVELASSVSSVPQARHLVAEDLAKLDLPPGVIENALLIVTELVTNAILHAEPLDRSPARGVIQLRWTAIGHEVVIDVSDGGGMDRPHVRQAAAAEDAGRGLSIVDAVAREWGVHTERGQVTVHAVVGPWEPSVSS